MQVLWHEGLEVSRYTRTIDVPAAAGPQDVTLDAFPAQHTTRLQVTKVPDAGDIWLALAPWATVATDGRNMSLMESGNAFASFDVADWATLDGAGAWVFKVIYPAGGKLYFEAS